MANSQAEIMLSLLAKDNASQTFRNIDKNAQSMASHISSSISSVNSSLMNLGQVNDNLMQGLTGKSALDNILGTSSKAETNKVLLRNMSETQEGYEQLYDTVDKVTDQSLTSMQELIPSMKAFKSATNATDQDMIQITDDMANFGASVLAQTGSVDLAQQAMMDLSKGIGGSYAALDQYGITEEALKRTGYWNGDPSDVVGFMKAVTAVTGSTKELMETDQGLDALIGKSFSRAGKKIGNDFLPIIKDVKRSFLELDDEMGGALAASILTVSAGIETANRAFWNISTAVNGVKDLTDAFSGLTSMIKGAGEAAESTNASIQTIGNASEYINGAGVTGDVIGTGAEVIQDTPKIDVVDSGSDVVDLADLIKSNKSENEKMGKWIKELEDYSDGIDEAQDTLDYISEKGGLGFNQKPSNIIKDMDKFGPNQLEKASSKFDKRFDKKEFFSGYGKLEDRLEEGFGDYFDKISKTESKYGKKWVPNKDGGTNTIFDYFREQNKDARDRAGELLDDFGNTEHWVDDVAEEWEKSGWGLSDAIKNKMGNFKNSITSPFKSAISSIRDFNFGETLQNGIKKGFGGLTNIAANIKNKITNFGSSLANLKNINLGEKIKNAFSGLDKKAYQKLSDFSLSDSLKGLKDKFKGLKDTADVIDDAGDVGKSLEGAKDIADGVEDVATAGSAISAAGPAIEAGAAGGEAAAAGASGLAATFTSMIVPLLAISAVIIIMIPIVAVIAAEAMIFLKLLAEFMEAMNFDNINLDGAIRGISQIAIALVWVGVAMAAMTFAGIMTGLAVIVSGFGDILGPLNIAIDAIKKAGQKLSEFSSLGINPSVATNLKSISDSLLSVSKAMLALTATTITTGFSNFVAWALGFGSVTNALDEAKNDIMAASQKLSEFSGLTPIDESVANNIQNVCNSLASVGDAMSALRSIRDGENWDALIGDLIGGIFGEGVDIQQALTDVKEDIFAAAKALQGWDLPDIDGEGEGTKLAEKVKKVSDTLTSLGEAFQTLRKFRDDGIWDDMINNLGIFGEGTNIQTALATVVEDINSAASALTNLKIDDAVNEDLIKKIQNIVNGINEVVNVSNSLTSLPPMDGFDSNIISTAVTNVQIAANKLKELDIGDVNEDTIATIKNVSAAITEISGVLTSLSTLPPMDGFDSSTIATAVTNVQTAITELNKLTETTFYSEGVNGLLSSVQTTLDTLKTTLSSASGFSECATGIGSQIVSGVQSGLAPLADAVRTEVSSACNSSGSAALSGGVSIGNTINNGFQSSLNLHDIMTTEMGYVKTAVDNGISAAKTAAQNGAQEVVQAFKDGVNVGSPGDIARTMSGEMNYTLQAIKDSYYALKNAAYTAAKTIVDAFGNPSLGYETFLDNNFNLSDVGSLQTTISPAPTPADNRPVTIIVNEGAVNVDARNKTTQEARQIMITALESLDNVKDVRV